jgi:hypothetical protein
MTGAELWPIAGAAAVGLARATASAVSDGLSFAAELARGADDSSAAADLEGEDARVQARRALDQRIEAFAERVRRQLAAAGIELGQPLTLTSDGLGGIAVAGDHPQRALIEDVLSSDVLLQRDFQRLADEQRGELSVIIPGAEANSQG